MAQAPENTDPIYSTTESDTLAAIDRSIDCLRRCEHPERQFLLSVMSEDRESHSLRLSCDTQLIMETVDSLLTHLKEQQPLPYLKLILSLVKQLRSSADTEALSDILSTALND